MRIRSGPLPRIPTPLFDDSPGHELSGGQWQKVAIARASIATRVVIIESRRRPRWRAEYELFSPCRGAAWPQRLHHFPPVRHGTDCRQVTSDQDGWSSTARTMIVALGGHTPGSISASATRRQRRTGPHNVVGSRRESGKILIAPANESCDGAEFWRRRPKWGLARDLSF